MLIYSFPVDIIKYSELWKEVYLYKNSPYPDTSSPIATATVLNGSLPSEIGLLTSLLHLNLSGNAITGAIPTQIGQLTKLTNLDLSFNRFTGDFPTAQVFTLPNLVHFHWRTYWGMPYTSSMVINLGNGTCTSQRLQTIAIKTMSIQGSFPSCLFKMTALTFLRFEQGFQLDYKHPNSDINSTIPTELGLLTNLNYLSLQAHGLRGTLPSEIANIRYLNFLNVRDNSLTGARTS